MAVPRLLALVACVSSVVCAQMPILPLGDLRPGMRGIGKTVFSGNRVEEFQVEILGVLENIGPRQSVILGRLSGGPLPAAGVLQGMSGSPVYVEGKLVGAVAMAFAFSKEPIAGIRPIEEMLAIPNDQIRPPAAVRTAALFEKSLAPFLPPQPQPVAAGNLKLVDIATPLSFGGFTRDTIRQFEPQLRALGLEPLQGTSGGGTPPAALGNPAKLQPGSMISVQLLTGDMNIGADGTVTHIDGNRVYAFGHRFLATGPTEMPFARAEVLTLLPNLATSFKISAAREWMGAVTQDRNVAVAGVLGQRARLAPISIAVTHAHSAAPSKSSAYRMEMVNDPFLSPLLLQMAVFSAIDATERTLGAGSVALRGSVEFQGSREPVRLDNVFTGDFNVAMQASLGAALPLAWALQTGFDELRLRNISLTMEVHDEKRHFQIEQAWASRNVVRPGDTLDVNVVLSGPNGAEKAGKVSYTVPIGATPGPLYFTIADGNTTNLSEFRHLVGTTPRSAGQVVSLLNQLRGNDKAYVRVWRAEPGYQIQGEDYPSPPASLSLILAKAQATPGVTALAHSSKLAELEISAGNVTVAGARTVQVEIKE